jgi:carbohydrate kinase (thermoresistant glucokinase family)
VTADAVPGIVVMGVSGVGKTTVAEVLAARLGWAFLDADKLHPPGNVAKMRSGTPLTDDDRWPWFEAIGAEIDRRATVREPIVVACSALKRAYRNALYEGRPGLRLVYLHGTRELIMARLEARKGHYFPATLLDSQLAALEEPDPAERAIIAGVKDPIPAIVDQILCQLG